MNRRDFLEGAARRRLARPGTAALLRMRQSQMRGHAETFEVTKTDAEWHAILSDAAFAVLRQEDTEYPGTSPLLKEKRKGIFHLRRLRPAALLLRDQVRFRHRLAEFLGRAAERRRQDRGQLAGHDAHRGPLPPLRRPSRPCLRRRSAADRHAPLHQRRRPDLQAGHGLTDPTGSEKNSGLAARSFRARGFRANGGASRKPLSTF